MSASNQPLSPAYTPFIAIFRLVGILFSIVISGQAGAQNFEIIPEFWQTNGEVRAIETDTVNNIVYIGGDFTKVAPNSNNAALLSTIDATVLQYIDVPNGQVNIAVEDGLGGWYIGGDFSAVGGEARSNLAQINSNGVLTQWAPLANGIVHCILLHQGKLYVGGEFTGINESIHGGLAALDPATGEVLPFDPALDGTVQTMQVANEKLYVGGSFTRANVQFYGRVVLPEAPQFLFVDKRDALNASPREIRASVPDGNGGYFIGGDFERVNGVPRNRIAHIDSSGNVTAWNPGADGTVLALKLDNGVLYVGGQFTTIGENYRARAAALNAETAEVLPWDPNLSGTANTIELTDSTVYIGGLFGRVGKYNEIASIFQESDGEITSPIEVNPNGAVMASVPDGNGGWYVGGNFTTYGGLDRSRLAQIDANGQVTDWNPGANGTVRTIAVSGNTVYVGGEFTRAGGQIRNRLAAINTITGTANFWNPNANNTIYTLAVEGNTVFIGGDFTNMGGSARSRIAAVRADNGALISWNPSSNGRVNSLVVHENVVYVGGTFTNIASTIRSRIAAINASTGALLPWNPGANDTVEVLAIASNVIYVGGSFISIAGTTRNCLAALDLNTGAPLGWNPEISLFSVVRRLQVRDEVVYAGGNIFSSGANPIFIGLVALDNNGAIIPGATPTVSSAVQTLTYSAGKIFTGTLSGLIGGDSRQNAASFDKVTGVATPWRPNPNGEVLVMKIAENTIFLGGSFSSLGLTSGSVTRNRVAEVDLITASPTPFAPVISGLFAGSGTVNTLLLTPSTIYVGGSFSSVNGFPRNHLAAIDRAVGAITTWNPNPSSSVLSLAHFDNDVIVGGNFASIGGQNRSRVARLSLQSGLATSWNPGQSWVSVRSLSVQNSEVFIGASANLVIGENTRNNAAAFDVSSGNVLGWNPNTNNVVYALHVKDNLVFLGGSFSNVGGSIRNRMASVDSINGSVLTFNPNISGSGIRRVNSMTLSNDGTVLYVGGRFSGAGGATRNNLAAFNAQNGNLLPWTPSANDEVNSIAFKPADDSTDVRIFVCGQFTSISSQTRNRCAAINANGSIDTWQTDFLSTNSSLSHISFASGRVFLGGVFEGAGAIERNRIAALNMITGAPIDFPVSVNNPVYSMQLADSTLYLGGDFTNVNGLVRNRLAAANRFTGEILDWNPNSNNLVNAIQYKDDLLYVGGNFTSVGGSLRNRVACLNTTTGFATLWHPNANNTVNALVIEENQVYVGGTFTNIGGASRSRIARINRETGNADSWNPNANSTVVTIAVGDSMVHLGGFFSVIGGTAQESIAAVSKSTGSALAFKATFDDWVSEIKLFDNKIFIGGLMRNVNGIPQRAFAVVDEVSQQLYPSNLDFADVNPTAVSALSIAGSNVYMGGNFRNAGTSGKNFAVASFDFSECTIVLDCPPVQIPLPITGETVLDPNLVKNQFTNCNEGLIKTFSPSSLDCSNLGDNVITATVSNQVGDTATCLFLARLVDTTPPVITPPDTLVLSTLPGSCLALVEGLVTPEASDNCSEVTITNNAPANLPKGNNTITWTATDAEGLSSTAVQIVSVVDNEPPSLQVPADLSINSVASACGAPNPGLGSATATDNCGSTVITNNAPNSFPVGINFVTWTATDESGNSTTAQQAITVIDNRLPTITAPNHLQLTALPGACEVNDVQLGLPVTADNCGVASVSNNAPMGFPVGTTTVVWTVEDLSGNTATAVQTVTVTTDEVPEILCPENATRNADSSACSYEVQPTEFIPSINANCPIEGVVNSFNNQPDLTGASLPLGTTSIEYTVTGAGGIVANCTVAITVVDIVPPAIECPAPISTTTLPGQCGRVVEFALPVASDNCGLQSVERISGPASGAFFEKGNTNVVFQATDTQGNASTCTLEVNVVDLEAPVVTGCPLSITLNNNPNQCGAFFQYLAPSGVDNCPGASLTQVSGIGAGAQFPIGSTTESYVLTDASGNTASCTFTVTVVDVQPPVAVCTDITVELDTNNSATITEAQLAANSTDNCGIAQIFLSKNTFDINDVGVNLIVVTVVDAAGLSSECTALVTVLPGESQCTVAGGTISTTDPRQGLCVGDNKANLIQLAVVGNQGTSRFGLVRQSDLNIIATNSSGLFNMENYPDGNYFLGHISVSSLSVLAGVTNVAQLSGCYSLSNQLSVTTLAVNGGTITTADPTTLCNDAGLGSIINFEVSGQQGTSFRWALLNQGGSSVVNSNTTGSFNLGQLAPGTYRVAHAASIGVNLASVNPANIPACVAVSNIVMVNVQACEPLASLSCSPNPTTDVSHVEFSIPREEQVFLELVDLSGKTVATVFTGMASAGSTYRHTVNTGGLSNGIYIYRLTTTREVIIEKLMVAR